MIFVIHELLYIYCDIKLCFERGNVDFYRLFVNVLCTYHLTDMIRHTRVN